ncbi:hypothetical protein [Sphingomonas sp.]|uniref:hypothetical protein n=1 Tax=Sphingomonas sp. TaxID=28214 RepID=UPI003BAC778A
MDQQQIIADLETRARAAGLTMGEACSRAELHPTTFSRWKQSERNPNPVGANLTSINKLKAVVEAAEEAAAAAPSSAEAA